MPLFNPPEVTKALLANTSGDLLGFDQRGAGAQHTNIKRKLGNIIYVTDYMTDAMRADVEAGTLAVDCSSAFQAALDVCSGKANNSLQTGCTLYVPGGRYLISQPLLYDWRDTQDVLDDGDMRRIAIRGDGQANTFLVYKGPGSSWLLTVTGNTGTPNDGVNLRFIMSGFRILCADYNKTRFGLRFNKVSYIWLQDMYIGYFSLNLYLGDCIRVYGQHLEIAAADVNLRASFVTFSSPNIHLWQHCHFTGGGDISVDYTQAANVKFDTCGFEGNGISATASYVMLFQQGPNEGGHAATVENCYFEGNTAIAEINIIQTNGNSGTWTIKDNSFNWAGVTDNQCTHINLTATGTGKLFCDMTGNAFKVFGAYTPGSRKVWKNNGFANRVFVWERANYYQYSADQPLTNDLPVFGRPYSFVAASATVVMDGSNNPSLEGTKYFNFGPPTKVSTGLYDIPFKYSFDDASIMAVVSPYQQNGFFRVVSSDATKVRIETRNASSVLQDLNFTVQVMGNIAFSG